MNNYTLWIDHNEAHIICISDDDNEVSHIINEKNFHPTKEHLQSFYHDVAMKLENANHVLLMGPGVAKDEFKNHCELHHPQIDHAIIKIESTRTEFTPREMIKASSDVFLDH